MLTENVSRDLGGKDFSEQTQTLYFQNSTHRLFLALIESEEKFIFVHRKYPGAI